MNWNVGNSPLEYYVLSPDSLERHVYTAKARSKNGIPEVRVWLGRMFDVLRVILHAERVVVRSCARDIQRFLGLVE